MKRAKRAGWPWAFIEICLCIAGLFWIYNM